MIVSSFLDESGKFKDHEVVALGGVSSLDGDFSGFASEWGRLLGLNGLRELSAKRVLNHRRPLSNKNPRIGLERRIDTLLPFIRCIRKHLQVVTGVVIDVRVFRKLPSHFFEYYGNDPCYVAFATNMLGIMNFTPSGDHVTLICDDEEQTALPFYKLYRRIRKVWPDAKRKLAAISFADDRHFFALQAADLVTSLIRLEGTQRVANETYEYQALFEALTKAPEKNERLWEVGIALGNDATLNKMADGLREHWKRAQEAMKNESKASMNTSTALIDVRHSIVKTKSDAEKQSKKRQQKRGSRDSSGASGG